MININKYRKLSILAVILLVITWILSLASMWNSLLASGLKNNLWMLFFMISLGITGLGLFYIAFLTTDSSQIEKIRREAYESGKSEIIRESERKKQVEIEVNTALEDSQKVVDAVLAGISTVRSEGGLCNKLLVNLARELGFVQGIMYVKKTGDTVYNPAGEYALTDRKPEPFTSGEGLPGQTAMNKTMSVLYDIPENYFKISSGLGNAQPRYLLIIPVVYNDQSIAVLELAAFKKPDDFTAGVMDKILSEVGQKLNKLLTA
jgi:hypothetical protein